MRATTRLAASLFCLFLFAAHAFAETELSPQQLERLEALYDKILADEITSLSMDELREYFGLELNLQYGDEDATIAALQEDLIVWAKQHGQEPNEVLSALKEPPKPQFITVSYQPVPNFGNYDIERLLRVYPDLFEEIDTVVLPDPVTFPNINFNFTNLTQQLNGINQATTFSAVQAGLKSPIMPLLPQFTTGPILNTTFIPIVIDTQTAGYSGPYDIYTHLGVEYTLQPRFVGVTGAGGIASAIRANTITPTQAVVSSAAPFIDPIQGSPAYDLIGIGMSRARWTHGTGVGKVTENILFIKK